MKRRRHTPEQVIRKLAEGREDPLSVLIECLEQEIHGRVGGVVVESATAGLCRTVGGPTHCRQLGGGLEAAVGHQGEEHAFGELCVEAPSRGTLA